MSSPAKSGPFTHTLAGRLSIVTGATLLIGALMMAVGFAVAGFVGMQAAALAVAVCLVAALVALPVEHLMSGPELAFPSVLVGMAIRSGLPLVVCMAVYYRRGALADAGFAFYLLPTYLIILALETGLSVRRIADSTRVTA